MHPTLIAMYLIWKHWFWICLNLTGHKELWNRPSKILRVHKRTKPLLWIPFALRTNWNTLFFKIALKSSLSEKVLAARSDPISICDKWLDRKLINATARQSFGKTMWSWSRLQAFSVENPISNSFPSLPATTIQTSLSCQPHWLDVRISLTLMIWFERLSC